MKNKEILNILQKAAGAKFSFNSKGEIWLSGSIAHCSESEGISEEKYNDEVYPKMKNLLESIPWTKVVENPRYPKENEYPEENGWYITMLDCNEHEILVNRFEKGDSGWSFYNKTHIKWWMPLTDELKHEIIEIISYSCNTPEGRVSPKVAKLLKKKGFDEYCHMMYINSYTHNGEPIDEDEQFELESEGKGDEIEIVECGNIWEHWNKNSSNYEMEYACPLIQTVCKWLREVHKIHIEIGIGTDVDGNFCYIPAIYDLNNLETIGGKYKESVDANEFNISPYMTFEQVELCAIEYCLLLI